MYGEGQTAEAERLYRKSLAIEEKTVGDEHPYTMRALEGLANCLSTKGQYAEAEQMHRKILAIRVKNPSRRNIRIPCSLNTTWQTFWQKRGIWSSRKSCSGRRSRRKLEP